MKKKSTLTGQHVLNIALAGCVLIGGLFLTTGAGSEKVDSGAHDRIVAQEQVERQAIAQKKITDVVKAHHLTGCKTKAYMTDHIVVKVSPGQSFGDFYDGDVLVLSFDKAWSLALAHKVDSLLWCS